MWEVGFTEEFNSWWDTLNNKTQIKIDAVTHLLEQRGPSLEFPYSSHINGSKHSQMRELRIQAQGKPYRIFYAFDPERHAILLIGGLKTDNKNWYQQFIARADNLYDKHLHHLGEKYGKTF